MGKHTQRKPGYLPKVAASAAPLALLLAAPASALAEVTTPIEGLPLRHGESGTFDHGRRTTADTAPGVLGRSHHDVRPLGAGGFPALPGLRPTLAGTQDRAGSGSLTAVKSANGATAVSRSQYRDVRLGSPARLHTGSDQHVTRSGSGAFGGAGPPDTRATGVDGSAEHGVRRPYGADALNRNPSHTDFGRARPFDAGHFTGDLRGGTGAHRPAGDAEHTGPLGSVVVDSDEHGLGQFVGRLDHPGADHLVSEHRVTGDLGPAHPASADLGPVPGPAAQSADAASSSFRGTLSLDGPPPLAITPQ
ncbi:hypothetical protein [Amycolatopsis sp. PS_44_ISF1]|uniref:hypothetical protein n=1 Tax=Amycolatopsis sp. PS_44_ISF1 TaxID=2974917 RepID=UPI0028DFBDAC|nr:hypothetical protein [Amycolatopsis sp. PS_44_ISF1]MDT8910608.1 hypothetical protein [Amycolatopsis sp. PS_44_ISF1]